MNLIFIFGFRRSRAPFLIPHALLCWFHIYYTLHCTYKFDSINCKIFRISLTKLLKFKGSNSKCMYVMWIMIFKLCFFQARYISFSIIQTIWISNTLYCLKVSNLNIFFLYCKNSAKKPWVFAQKKIMQSCLKSDFAYPESKLCI